MQKITEFLSLLYANRLTIDYLFNHRPQGKSKYELFDFDDGLTEDRLINLTNKEVIQKNNDTFNLDERLAEFLEDFLQIGDREAKIGGLNDDLKGLNLNAEIFSKNQDSKYLAKMRRLLQKLDIGISSNVLRLYNSINDTYKTEKHFETKKLKLENYRADRDEIFETIENLNSFLDNYKALLKIDNELFNIKIQLEHHIIINRRYLLELQTQIIDYINKIQIQSVIYRKIGELKAFKDRLGGLNETNSNIKQVAGEHTAFFLYDKLVFSYKLPIDFLLDNDEGKKLIERIRQKNQIELRNERKTEKIDRDAKIEIEEEKSIVISDLFELFKDSNDNLFNFIQKFDFPTDIPTLNYEKRISLFVEMSMDFEYALTFTENYQNFTWFDEIHSNEQALTYQVIFSNK